MGTEVAKKKVKVPVLKKGKAKRDPVAAVAKRRKKKNAKRGASWDLETHGVTKTFINTFLNCPEHTRLRYLEMWSSSAFSEAMEYGNIFHYIHERHVGHGDSVKKAVAAYEKMWVAERQGMVSKENLTKLRELSALAALVFKYYLKYWDDHNRDTVFVEQDFCFYYEYEDGLRVPCRGKFDEVFSTGKKRKRYWLHDVKTKGRVNEDEIQSSLLQDIQVNLYFHAMRDRFGSTPAGVVYNIVRKPQKYRRKDEAMGSYLKRIEEDIQERMDFYFVKFDLTITKAEMDAWWKDQFVPIMQRIRDWAEGKSHTHYLNPNALHTQYGKSDMFNIITKGDNSGYYRRSKVYPELDFEGAA
jgi:hypothetical protein